MPVAFFLIAAGLAVGYLGLTGNGTLTLIGIALLAVGMLASAVIQGRRRERDRRADAADAREAARLARR